jgi:hypothetical protein
MRLVLAVFRLPPLHFASEAFHVPKALSSIEILGVCLVAPLDLTVHWRTSWRDVTVRDAEIRKMRGGLWSKRRVVVRLDSLEGKGKMLSTFP